MELFPKVLGNGKMKERICTGILNGTLPHAFLIIGAEGAGKSTLAREISAALNCESKGDANALPCGNCNSCRRIYEGNFPDVKILAKPKDKATLGVELIKDFREDMFLSSTESNYKIYIIDDGECMTKEAQNALLKVLEEPPNNVMILILATEGDKILTTIKSRAQHISMERFCDLELEEHLIKLSSDARDMKRETPDRFRSIIMSSDGRIGLGIKLSSKKHSAECEKEREEIIEIIRAVTGGHSYREIRSAMLALPSKRPELLIYLEKLTAAIRDLIVIKESKSAGLTFFSSRAEAEAAGAQITVKALIKIYDEIQKTHELCSRNANVSNLIAGLTARLKLV